MSKTSTQSLADGMRKAARHRSANELQEMFGGPRVLSAVVPLADATYEIPMERIAPDPNQPRKTFDPEELQDLSRSIKENGVLQPITVYESPETPGLYVIVTGERRFRAAKLAGLAAVPCILRASDFDRSQIDQEQLVENIQRADLAPIEAAHALYEFTQRHGYSQRQAAQKLGKPLTFVAELVSILKIPAELLNQKGADRLSKSTLLEITRADASQRPELLRQALVGAPLRLVQERRVKRRGQPRVTYYREYFPLKNQPPIGIQWRKDPDEVTREELAAALGEVIQQIVGRGTK